MKPDIYLHLGADGVHRPLATHLEYLERCAQRWDALHEHQQAANVRAIIERLREGDKR